MSARAVPHSRNADPVTSHIAGESAYAEGIAATQGAIVLALLERHPGSTSLELATLGGLDRYLPSRRLVDLEREGFAVRGELRKCRVGGRLSQTWLAAHDLQGRLL